MTCDLKLAVSDRHADFNMASNLVQALVSHVVFGQLNTQHDAIAFHFCIHRSNFLNVLGYEPSCSVLGPIGLTHLSSEQERFKFAHFYPIGCGYICCAAWKFELDLTPILDKPQIIIKNPFQTNVFNLNEKNTEPKVGISVLVQYDIEKSRFFGIGLDFDEYTETESETGKNSVQVTGKKRFRCLKNIKNF